MLIKGGMSLPESACNDFRRNPDGTWTSVTPVTISGYGGEIKIDPGITFTKGTRFKGIDVAAWLNEYCAFNSPAK